MRLCHSGARALRSALRAARARAPLASPGIHNPGGTAYGFRTRPARSRIHPTSTDQNWPKPAGTEFGWRSGMTVIRLSLAAALLAAAPLGAHAKIPGADHRRCGAYPSGSRPARHGGEPGGARHPRRRRGLEGRAATRSTPRSRTATLWQSPSRAGNIGGGGFMLVHLAWPAAVTVHRLPRDRAGSDQARRLLDGREAIKKVGARRWRARDGRGLGLAREKYGFGSLPVAELMCAGARAGAQGLHGEGRPRRCAARCGAAHPSRPTRRKYSSRHVAAASARGRPIDAGRTSP